MLETRLLERLREEALAMLARAHDYTQKYGPMDFLGEDVELGLDIARESVRISSCLTQVIAWCLTQKAMIEGHISLEEARNEDYRIVYEGELVACNQQENIAFPKELKQLLDQSLALYERVCRLDTIFWRQTAA